MDKMEIELIGMKSHNVISVVARVGQKRVATTFSIGAPEYFMLSEIIRRSADAFAREYAADLTQGFMR